MGFLSFWLRCLAWAFAKAERAEGTVTTLALLGLNWSAAAATVGLLFTGVPPLVKWVPICILAIMLFVVAPWRIHRLIDDGRVMDNVRVWEKNAELRASLGRALNPPHLKVDITCMRPPPIDRLNLLVTNHDETDEFVAEVVGWTTGSLPVGVSDHRWKVRWNDHQEPSREIAHDTSEVLELAAVDWSQKSQYTIDGEVRSEAVGLVWLSPLSKHVNWARGTKSPAPAIPTVVRYLRLRLAAKNSNRSIERVVEVKLVDHRRNPLDEPRPAIEGRVIQGGLKPSESHT